MLRNYLQKIISKNKITLLGVGPMSLNCINAVIALSNQYSVPIFLIASRRQIDSDEFKGGYVNNWNTKEYCDYVLNRDKKGKVILARDHGGPWQNPIEVNKKLSLSNALESAKKSFKEDIDSGFKVLHIDTCKDIHGSLSQDDSLERLFELYEYCWSYAKSQNKQIIFEIGTEEQSGSTNALDQLEYNLKEVTKYCDSNLLPKPTFVVVQTGTKVMETRNIGSFDKPLRVENEIPALIQLPKIIEICKKYNIFIKEHNTDYLSDDALEWHPRLGIHASNVAPEFGVTETLSLIKVLEDNSLNKISEEFLSISYKAKFWSKWMLNNSNANDRQKAIVGGHYVFSNPDVIELKKKAGYQLSEKGINIDAYLEKSVSDKILRYLKKFRLVK
tara:strand:+ start:3515 stop:4678 length:1164 start_codon:yes stop_codon:yes gene_type:complete